MRVGRVSWILCGALAAWPAQAATDPGFQATTQELSATDIARMTGRSWQEGCPVPLKDLVSLHMTYRSYDGAVGEGVLVIHRRLATETVDIFRQLFAVGFRIARMQPYEDFGQGEYASSNDTVGFYCRPAQDDPGSWSWHAYGMAIDINPLTNPFDDPKEGWWPPGSAGNSDRTTDAPGKLAAGSPAVAILLGHGWAWSGFADRPDYMHFGKVTIGGGSNPLERPVWAERLRYAPNGGANGQ